MSFQRTALVAVGIIGTEARRARNGCPLLPVNLEDDLIMLRGVVDDGKVPGRCGALGATTHGYLVW